MVEDLAQPQPRPARTGRSESQDFSPERPGATSRGSFDLSSASRNITQSTGLLAESAITNLRKSLASQRPFTGTSPDGRGSPRPDRELRPVSKPTLEDRLKASFAIGEASNVTTPDVISHSSSPKPIIAKNNETILSPKSTPLPESPLQLSTPSRADASQPPLNVASSTPTEGTYTDPLQMALEKLVQEPEEMVNAGASEAEVKDEVDAGVVDIVEEGDLEATEKESLQEGAGSPAADDIQVDPSARLPEADIPLPPFSPNPTNLAATQSSRPPSLDEAAEAEIASSSSLKRLVNSLEQRLAGDKLNIHAIIYFLYVITDANNALEELRNSHESASGILGELTPIKKISDIVGLRHYLQDIHAKHNVRFFYELISVSSHCLFRRRKRRLSDYRTSCEVSQRIEF